MNTPHRVYIVFIIALVFCAVGTPLSAMAGSTLLYRIIPDTINEPKEDNLVRRRATVLLESALFDLYDLPQDRSLRLPTFDTDFHGQVTWERVTGPNSFSVAGELSGDESGYFIVTVHNGVAAVTIQDVRSRWLCLVPTAEDYVLEERDLDALPECGTCQAPNLFRLGSGAAVQSAPAKRAKDDPPTQIDVMVVYTTAARSAAGGAANIEAQIMGAADLANLAYANSEIALEISVVHMAELNFQEEFYLAMTLAKLTFPAPGSVFEEVHTWRDEYDADMVALITNSGDHGGIAWMLSSLEGPIDHTAFSITVRGALGGLVFAHELGHNMGCDHDEENATAEGFRLFNYSRGWRFVAAEDDILYCTLMSYPPGVRIPYFSNPNILFKGTPTGVPVGHPDEAHCAQTINISAPYIALNRPRGEEGEGEGESPNIYEGHYCEILGNLYHNDILRGMLPPFADLLFELLYPDTADLNGYADPGSLSFEGNGMLDCAYELGLLRRIIETPGLDLSATGGVTHAMVAQALDANRARLTSDIGPAYAPLLEVLAPGLIELASAYLTIGDAGSVGFISLLWDIVNQVHYIGQLSLHAYVRLPEYLSAEGDADGDGATNREEYEVYAAFGPQVYIAYALNPSIYPTGGGPGQVRIVGRPRVEAGKSLTLTAETMYIQGETVFAWYKDGDALPGIDTAVYHILHVTPEDGGHYQVVILDESMNAYESPLFTLEVLQEGSMPVARLLAVLLLCLALSCIGIFQRRGIHNA